MKHSEFNNFAGHSIDFHPIAKADTVFSHEHEPTQETDDEILQRHGQARAGEPQNRSKLAWRPENHQQDEQHRADLHYHPRQRPHRFDLPAIE